MADQFVNRDNSTVTKEKLVEDFKVVLKDVESLLKDNANQLGDKAAGLRDKLDQGIRRAKVQLEKIEDDVIDRSKEAAKYTDNLVHDHPWEAVGVGFGLGVVIGILINRR